MKKPFLFGFAVLCVLSTPNLLEEKIHTAKEATYRTIASQELRPDNRPDKPPRPSIEGEDKDSRPPHPRQENPPVDKEKNETISENDGKESDEKVVTNIKEENKTEEKVEEPTLDKDISVCEYRNEIDELKQQISELIEDKEEVIAEVDKEKKSKDTEEDEDKEESKDKKEEKLAKIPSRYQQILSMGLIFGQGFQSSFQMPMMRFGSNSFLNTQPIFTLRNNSTFGSLQDDTSWMTSGVQSMMNVGRRTQGLSQSLGTNRELFIPSFTRTSIKSEGFSIN